MASALAQQYYMLQTELDVNQFVNDLKENGRSKTPHEDFTHHDEY